jgi:ubiquinone/menaquinone biosynthesis C-methylase UbiE
MKKDFYKQVETYYDSDAPGFDRRYWQNHVLQRIRQDFREEVKRHAFSDMLEIGYGTGLDLLHFGKTHPEASVAGIDISGGMLQVTNERIRTAGLTNVVARKGSVEQLESLFPNRKFDMVYVFFGALNTVDDLHAAARHIHRVTAPGGILVLSFVNKHYLGGMLIELLKLRPRAAFSRLKTQWGGYSPSRFLPSRCYSPKEIRKAFAGFKLLKTKGYSIVHPAWYYHGLNRLLRRLSPWLWKADKMLNRTPLWKSGEYSLFVFQKPERIGK